MKLFKFLLIAFLSAALFTACNKDKDDTVINIPASELTGVFEGKFGTGSNNPSSFYSFNIKADGTMEELGSGGTVNGTGTWTITGNVFRATHHYTFPATSFFVTTGVYDPATKTISGTWGYGSSDSDGGKWYMTKK